MRRLFPIDRLETADYIAMSAILMTCFFSFYHWDLWAIGWASLNYMFQPPLEFYETPRAQGYPPSIYIIFSAWLYPYRLLGQISSPDEFPTHLVYWIKALTTIVFFASALLFYSISREYRLTKDQAKFAAGVWLASPLAVYSQFIFSQIDIFYVALTLAGVLTILRRRLILASMFFGLAMTFKFFPLFVFAPLILLYEKRISRLICYCIVFSLPLILIFSVYDQSPGFHASISNHFTLERIYAAEIDIQGWRIYFLFVSFAILCGMAFFLEVNDDESRSRAAAWLWLTSSILPFLFILWHPQWVIFLAPAVALTSVINRQFNKLLVLDLVGMFLFVATTSLTFQFENDAVMFKFHEGSYSTPNLFSWFHGHSASVFFSCFFAYLLLQVALKSELLIQGRSTVRSILINYDDIRRRLYIGLLIFLIPTFVVIYKDATAREEFVNCHFPAQGGFSDYVSSGMLEQTFVPKGTGMTQVSVFLSIVSTRGSGHISIQILDDHGNIVASAHRNISDAVDNDWNDFDLRLTSVSSKGRYRIRLTADNLTAPQRVSWLLSRYDFCQNGEASVDGSPVTGRDFAFRASFIKE